MQSYPPWLEDWWLQRATRTSGHSPRRESLAGWEREVQQLSDLFTKERDGSFGDYAGDETRLLAYGLFFFPQSFARIQFPLIEALKHRQWHGPVDRPLCVLDLGTGLGGTALGLATCLENATPIEKIHITALDRSLPSLAVFGELTNELAEHWPRTCFHTHAADMRHSSGWPDPPETGWDLITIGFSLNEAFQGASLSQAHLWLDSLLSRLSPKGLLVITEPSLRETSERLEQLRDRVAGEGRYHIWAPCLHRRPCPLWQKGEYWCHEVRRWESPASLTFLNRHLHREIQALKFSFLVLGRAAPPTIPPGPSVFRLVSPLSKMKGRFLASGCASDGCGHTYEFPTRGLTGDFIRKLREYARGDILQIAPWTTRGEVLRVAHSQSIKAVYQPGPGRSEP